MKDDFYKLFTIGTVFFFYFYLLTSHFKHIKNVSLPKTLIWKHMHDYLSPWVFEKWFVSMWFNIKADLQGCIKPKQWWLTLFRPEFHFCSVLTEMYHMELQGHLQHPFNRFSKQIINMVLEFLNYLLNYDLIIPFFLQEFKVTYVIYGIKFYHKSHTEQPFLFSDMRTMQYFARSSKTGQQIVLSGHKLGWRGTVVLLWVFTGQQNWFLLPQGCSAEQDVMGSTRRLGKISRAPGSKQCFWDIGESSRNRKDHLPSSFPFPRLTSLLP